MSKATEPRRAYFILEPIKNKDGEYIPCIATEGEKGYHMTDWHWGTDLDHAEDCCDDKNKLLGITKEEAMKIVLSSMRQ